ncbi:MAG: lycopene cyclase domain-containing protein [Actinomycetes bacterium]
MRHLAYLGMLAVVVVTTLPLELVLHLGVYRQWRRLFATLASVVPVFVGWDLYAISRHQWSFDPAQTLGIVLPGGLPVEELLFFLVVPVAAVLTLEAVHAVRGWPIGVETPEDDP